MLQGQQANLVLDVSLLRFAFHLNESIVGGLLALSIPLRHQARLYHAARHSCHCAPAERVIHRIHHTAATRCTTSQSSLFRSKKHHDCAISRLQHAALNPFRKISSTQQYAASHLCAESKYYKMANQAGQGLSIFVKTKPQEMCIWAHMKCINCTSCLPCRLGIIGASVTV